MVTIRRTLCLLVSTLLIAILVGCEREDVLPQVTASETSSSRASFTVDQVNALRARTEFDRRALEIAGIVGIGTGGSSDTDSWINVLCIDDASLRRAQAKLGNSIEGVPIKYEVSGTISTQ